MAGKLGELTRIHPLHPVGEGFVCAEVITAPSRVRDDIVCGGSGRKSKCPKL